MVKRLILIVLGTGIWFPAAFADRGWMDPHPMRLEGLVGG